MYLEIHFSKKTQPVDYDGVPLFVPGCQLLATCKTAYLEGHEMFFTRNTFHLARGPISAVGLFGALFIDYGAS